MTGSVHAPTADPSLAPLSSLLPSVSLTGRQLNRSREERGPFAIKRAVHISEGYLQPRTPGVIFVHELNKEKFRHSPTDLLFPWELSQSKPLPPIAYPCFSPPPVCQQNCTLVPQLLLASLRSRNLCSRQAAEDEQRDSTAANKCSFKASCQTKRNSEDISCKHILKAQISNNQPTNPSSTFFF